MEYAARMAARHYGTEEMAEHWGLSHRTARAKLDGRAPLTIREVASVALLAGVRPSDFLV